MSKFSFRRLRSVALAVFAIVATGACSKSTTTSAVDTTASENSASAIAGAAASSDGGAVALLKMGPQTPTFANAIEKILSDGLVSKADAASCPTTLVGTNGSCGTTTTLSLNGCNPPLAPSASWSGSLLFTFSSSGVCNAVNTGGLTNMGASGYVTISSTGGVTRTAANGTYVSIDSNSSGWQTAYANGLQLTCNSADCLTGTGRTVAVLGEHRALYSAGGIKLFDHTLYTTTPFTVTGSGSSRVVASGALLLEHNLAHYLQTATITQPLTFSASCCFPTGGQVQTTFTGYYGHTATETTTFSSTCGQASVNGTTFTLTHCL